MSLRDRGVDNDGGAKMHDSDRCYSSYVYSMTYDPMFPAFSSRVRSILYIIYVTIIRGSTIVQVPGRHGHRIRRRVQGNLVENVQCQSGPRI